MEIGGLRCGGGVLMRRRRWWAWTKLTRAGKWAEIKDREAAWDFISSFFSFVF
jgi:hypothetical protein